MRSRLGRRPDFQDAELMSTMSCGDLAVAMAAEFPSLVGCTDPFEGRVAIGGVCASDMECESDYCSGDALCSADLRCDGA